MRGVGFEPTNRLGPELKSGAVDQAWQPPHPSVLAILHEGGVFENG